MDGVPEDLLCQVGIYWAESILIAINLDLVVHKIAVLMNYHSASCPPCLHGGVREGGGKIEI